MKINHLENKKIAFLGLGIENYALVLYLLNNKINCELTICDKRSKDLLLAKFSDLQKFKNINWQVMRVFNKNLQDFDMLFRSPGWPINCLGIQLALKKKSDKVQDFLYSPMKLFFDICPSKNIIGVTGTKGKGTTSSLIYKIIKKAGKNVFIGGNIGIAPFEFIAKVKKNDWVVLELSSFQLEDIYKSPKIAVVTNLSKEHLSPADPHNPNFHKSLAFYWKAKSNIFAWQKINDKLVVNIKLKKKIERELVKSKTIYFDKQELKSGLVGEHNQENIAAALEVARVLKIKKTIIENTIKSFSGLPFRIELIKKIKKRKFYNDSFATTPDATITALRSFTAPIILLAGGSDKGSDFSRLAKEIKKRVNFIVLFKGRGTDKIKAELQEIKYPIKNIKVLNNMQDAVKLANEKSGSEDVVLLSPACASFGVFKNYKERGELFNKAVKKI